MMNVLPVEEVCPGTNVCARRLFPEQVWSESPVLSDEPGQY